MISVAALLSTGFAATDAIEQNTAHALGLDEGSFTISDHSNDGIRTRYTVKTNTGRRYSCYVTGLGASFPVSDAMCTELGKAGQQATTDASCNALLKAAGKC
ncbi:hypothetical protein D8B22_06750 [Verminephrobacter aporrectodeae subsp. tuberculatae]|nr:hypothetical protein [Verminephrobacter aporrectodeae subsp. tuberculatae]MCW8168820.1 hypothetical protein [Verminephrobacter aporrectodeae subsp. tuberculatae]